jgi:hypothetical protein
MIYSTIALLIVIVSKFIEQWSLKMTVKYKLEFLRIARCLSMEKVKKFKGRVQENTKSRIPNRCAVKFQKRAAKFRNRTVRLIVNLNVCRNKFFLSYENKSMVYRIWMLFTHIYIL